LFTRNHNHKEPELSAVKGVLCAGREGASHEELIREAIAELRDQESADRVGVWLESPRGNQDLGHTGILRGQVWERDADNVPVEWTRLSTDAPLPNELLNAGKSVEYGVGGTEFAAILGPLLGLHRVLWVPVSERNVLRGLLMVGTKDKQKTLPRGMAERVATELGLLLEVEEQRRLARERQADLALLRRIENSLSREQSAESIFAQLVENCAGAEAQGGAGAVFALIGERQLSLPVASTAPGEDHLLVVGQSGDAAWAHSVQQGPLEHLWRQAVESGQVVGADAERLPLARDISRIVAIPLRGKDQVCGVLVAGLPRRKESLDILERLELRAALAAKVLEQKRRTEQELRARSWKQALLESSEEPTVLVSRQGVLLGMSRGARVLSRITEGAPECGADGMRFAEMFRTKDWERVSRWTESVFTARKGEEAPSLAAELRHGTSVKLRRLVISENEFLAVGLDREEEALSARTVEQVEAELQQSLEWLEEGVAVFDNHGRIRTLNTRFLQMLGLTVQERQELRSLEDLIRRVAKNAADPESFAQSWRRIAGAAVEQSKEELSMEWPVPQVIERNTRAIVGEKGARLGRVEVYSELTAQRMFQSRMVQTEKLAALGQRATGIVHELSNPLTTILGNAQRMVLHSPKGRSNTEALRILEEAERATAILRQLLYRSREMQPERRLVSLKELVQRTLELQRLALAGSPIRLEVEQPEMLLSVEGDFGQLQQILLNLLQNAQQALQESGKGTTIGVRTSLSNDGRVKLEVWDDGPGVPEAIQARIFDPFFTTKAPGVGTGLGLAIVQGFVRQHGGTVALHSPPEGGTRFVVELPAVTVGARAERRNREARPEETARGNRGEIWRKKQVSAAKKVAARVLVVEDEPTVAALIADVLRDEGMNVDVLLNSQSALRKVEAVRYDLLICDLKMPGVDGQTFYRMLAQRHNPLHDRVLFVTGDVLAPRSQEFLERNHLPHVAKPFRMEELSRAVQEVLQLKKSAPAGPEMTTKHAAGDG